MNYSIQYINYSGENSYEYEITEASTFNRPNSFDQYDINIIDLRDEYIWRNSEEEGDTKNIDLQNDFRSLKTIVENSEKSAQLYIFPTNVNFNTFYFGDRYYDAIELKDCLPDLTDILSSLVSLGDLGVSIHPIILYEITSTKLQNNDTVYADFYFNTKTDPENVLKKSSSNKIVAIQDQRNFLTTLDIENNSQLESFLLEAGVIEAQREKAPEWMNDIIKFNDEELKNNIMVEEEKIEESNSIILESKENLLENQKYKSILYINGERLVSVVIEILERIFKLDLSDFKDEKKEDLLFEVDGNLFICEIKGVTSNVKQNHLAQLDNHYTEYLDEHPDVDRSKIYNLLIINHQRNKPIEHRESVNTEVIEKANNKYGILIIETWQLLDLFEEYTLRKTTNDKILEFFKQEGLLKLETVN